MKTLGSSASVLAAMREDAAVELERIEQEAQAEAARLEAEGKGEIEPPDEEEKLAAASREQRERLAREDWDDARAALEARERWMERAADEGRKLLAECAPPEQRRATLRALVTEAMERLPGAHCSLHVAERDKDLLDVSLLEELGVAAGEPAPIAGGCILRCDKSPISVDDSFEERARRFEVQLRAALGKVYGS